MSLRSIVRRLKEGTEFLNYGRHVIAEWGARSLLAMHAATGRKDFHVFDTGCGHGDDLLGVRRRLAELMPAGTNLKVRYTGVEGYEPFVRECRAQGIETIDLDVEKDHLPFADASVDVIITNQLLEHTKEVFWIFSEYARILRPGGRLMIGVPNLASLHNRLLLLFGLHPTAQQTLSAHVRSFTLGDLRNFAEAGGLFRFIERRGSNFYPFPPSISRPLARIFPSMAWGLFVLLERTDTKGSFLDNLRGEDNFLETPFYGGPQRPAPVQRSSSARTSGKKAATAKRGERSRPGVRRS